MAQKEWAFDEIIRDIRGGTFYPVYLLMGDEPFYIDRISQALSECVLNDDERDFNQTILYGTDTDTPSVINTAKRYPMMAERQLVILREAQQVRKLDDLAYYLEKPQPTTVLIIEHKNDSVDKRKRFVSLAAKIGVVYESKKLYDNKIPPFIVGYLRDKNFQVTPKAAQMLVDFLGNDLNKIAGELDKLIISAGNENREITPELVESNIGISKEYNNYEFLDAIVAGDVLKANRIATHFALNQKNYPMVVTLSVLFNYFSNLMIAHYLPDKSEDGIRRGLSLRMAFQSRAYMSGVRRFSAGKTMQIISLIRECDGKVKGVGNISISEGDLLRELLFKILH